MYKYTQRSIFIQIEYPVVGRKTRVASKVHSRSRQAERGSCARGPSMILYRMILLPDASLTKCSSFDCSCWNTSIRARYLLTWVLVVCSIRLLFLSSMLDETFARIKRTGILTSISEYLRYSRSIKILKRDGCTNL